jgi:N-methylhydantoinase B
LELCRECVFVGHEPVVTLLADRAKFPPPGWFGGEAGKVARYSLITHGSSRDIRSKGSLQVSPGEILQGEACGGGGYGRAWTRDAASVLRDVRDGKISVQRARECYGVAIDTDTWTIEPVESERFPRQMENGKGEQ